MFIVSVTPPSPARIQAIFNDRMIKEFSKRTIKEALAVWKNDLAEVWGTLVSSGPLYSKGKLAKAVNNPNNIIFKETADGFVLSLRRIPFYAAVQEEGKRISAKGEYMAIPVGPAKAAKQKRTPRQYQNTFVVKGKKKAEKVIMWRRAGQDPVPIFALVKEIELEPRPWFSEGISRTINQFYQEVREIAARKQLGSY